MRINYAIIFFVSLFCIALELFLTRILNFKAWNHLVYVIIPFAILGYGIGANLYLIFKKLLLKFPEHKVTATALALLSVLCMMCTLFLIRLPIHRDFLANFFYSGSALPKLLVAYTVVMLPFIIIGFLVVYLFSENPGKMNKLYFFDLLGAGLGALVFFVLIYQLAVVRSLALLSLVALSLSLQIFLSRLKFSVFLLAVLISFAIVKVIPEPNNYAVDSSKGWEWVPGSFQKEEYKTLLSEWHPLGRTDTYLIKEKSLRDTMYLNGLNTFEINLTPVPEFSYTATNSLSGTPIYKLSADGLKENNSKLKLFSTGMEVAYTLFNHPKVVVIGTGGGRDIFIAKTHGAREVIGAEVNPSVYGQMMPGGKFYEYSGKIYTQEGVKIFNMDGRHLVKTLTPGTYELIVLNGVDTFSGLSSGAYVYAESYLYTKNAVMDYLRILKDQGIIIFNRWTFKEMPREELRLFAICLEALRGLGVKNPSEHIMVGQHLSWANILIKKTPFTLEEKNLIKKYFETHQTILLYPSPAWETRTPGDITLFDFYDQAFQAGAEKLFTQRYPCDISVITDNNPFFYKYYKFKFSWPFVVEINHHTGTIIFLTQIIVIIQALVFILLFILVPLWFFKKNGIEQMPKQAFLPFILYFSCLGVGFMFIEIPLMQRFVLLLGSPIHSISVSLTALLIFSGLGSYYAGFFLKKTKTLNLIPSWTGIVLTTCLILLVTLGTDILDTFVGWPFLGRVFIVFLFLLPLGLCLGVFFPMGLSLVGKNHQAAIAWAWGINCGFSVLGSMLAIILAQFQGFNFVLMLAVIIYLIAVLMFRRMEKAL